MECPSCGGLELSPAAEGVLVCEDCDEQFAGYRDEEMDDALAGTAVTTRMSQASQAQNVRTRMTAARKSASASAKAPVDPAENEPDGEVALCESVFVISLAIADALVRLRYATRSIKGPLFQIVLHWVKRRHAGVRYVSAGTPRVPFKAAHVLSLISLAAIYMRSPLLPRDLCRLAALGKIPFYTAARDHLSPALFSAAKVRDVLIPSEFVVPRDVMLGAITFGQDEYAWPPMTEFFKSNGRRIRNNVRKSHNLQALPLGHMHVTLLRIVRLLGLPDSFGARVVRFIELRRTAVKVARIIHCKKSGPWDDNKEIDAYPVTTKEEDPSMAWNSFSTPLLDTMDCYEHPTDRTLQVDIISTMRLCYGVKKRSTLKPWFHFLDPQPQMVEGQMKVEWEACKKSMAEWLRTGGDDGDVSVWTSLSPQALVNMRGESLRKYLRMVDGTLPCGKSEDMPHFMRQFVATFGEISRNTTASAPVRAKTRIENGRGDDDVVTEFETRHKRRRVCDPACADLSGMDKDCGLYVSGGEVKRVPRADLRQLPKLRRAPQKEALDSPSKRQRVNDETKLGAAKLINRERCDDDREANDQGGANRKDEDERSDRKGKKREREHEEPSNLRNLKRAEALHEKTENSEGRVRLTEEAESDHRDARLEKLETSSTDDEQSRESTRPKSDASKSTGRSKDGYSDGDMVQRPSKGDKPSTPFETNRYLFEPSGIGLAWTIIRRFFAGTPSPMSNIDSITRTNRDLTGNLINTCDATMLIVIKYMLGHLGETNLKVQVPTKAGGDEKREE